MKTIQLSDRLNSVRSPRFRRGSVLVLAASMLVAIFAFTSFTVDVGFIMVTKSELQTAADAGSLAAAIELSQGLGPAPQKTSAEVDLLSRAAAVSVAARNPSGDLSSAYVDSNRDVRLGQVNWDENTNSWVKNWGVAPYNMVEVSVLREEGAGTNSGPLPLFFAPIIGHETANVSASTTSAIVPGWGFRIAGGSGQTIGALPITLDVATWNRLVADNKAHHSTEFSDNYSYDPVTGAVTSGPDGIFEENFYPHGNVSLPPGNRGTVDLGAPGNSTADIKRQILYGLNENDLSYFGGELCASFESPLTINGDTGLSAGIKAELEAIKGQPRAIPLFSGVPTGNGNNAMYTVPQFVGVRIMHVKLTGNPKQVIIQPAPFVDSSVVYDGRTTTVEEAFIFSKPRSIR
ncbi:MAG: pilus assembly protein TadG-related protein [Planctomycetota bacterium]|nr:pilus assembly protein TadG-related protein [Planctomycetota bacterium]MDA1210972.1 pilus assembly protein TadG-related protein [Planctomycetota bacterium]